MSQAFSTLEEMFLFHCLFLSKIVLLIKISFTVNLPGTFHSDQQESSDVSAPTPTPQDLVIKKQIFLMFITCNQSFDLRLFKNQDTLA